MSLASIMREFDYASVWRRLCISFADEFVVDFADESSAISSTKWSSISLIRCARFHSNGGSRGAEPPWRGVWGAEPPSEDTFIPSRADLASIMRELGDDFQISRTRFFSPPPH